MIHNKIILKIALVTLIIYGCKENNPIEPVKPQSDKITLSFQINAKYNNEAYNWDNWQITQAGDTIKFNKVKYILSNFILVKQDGTQIPIANSNAFVSLYDNIKTFSFSDVPKGNYKSLIVKVGLDSATNHGDPAKYSATHPLNPSVSSMYWDWSGGYIFNVIEGNYKNNGATGGFSIHVASIANNRDYTLNYNFELTKNSKLTLDVNMEKYFSNNVNYSLKTDGTTLHSIANDPKMAKFLSNSNGIISISAFE